MRSISGLSVKVVKPSARHRARRLVMQALYKLNVFDTLSQNFSQESLIAEITHNCNSSKVDIDYVVDLLKGIEEHKEVIKKKLHQVIDRPFTAIDPLELAILYFATYELLYRRDVPEKVVIKHLADQYEAVDRNIIYYENCDVSDHCIPLLG